MLRFARWKIASIIAMIVVAFLVVIPSLLSPDARDTLRARLPSWLPVEAVVLGLDLQGGAHLLYEVDSGDVVRTQVAALRDDVVRIVREQRVRIAGGVGINGRIVQVRVPDAGDRDKVSTPLRALAQPGGLTALGALGPANADFATSPDGLIQLTVTQDAVDARVRRAVEQTIEVLNRRVNALGTVEPNIQRQGNDRVLVEVPGLQDIDQLKRIVGTTAKLEFRFVANPGANPGDVETLQSTDGYNPTYSVEKRVIVAGEDLTDAQPGFDQQTGQAVVNFKFNIRGGQQFGQATAANIGRPFAIVLDNKVISAPVIRSAITGGSGQISGNYTVQSANDLSVLLRAGALPAKLSIVEERTVGPGLGQDSIDAGKRAAYVGAFLVIAYMLVTYGVFGVFADIALIVHIAFIFAGIVLLRSTLTLPGIAGIVLTIGFAVDSNVLIYERIREEHKAGRSIIASLDAGFKRAFATIIDSNSTMLVAAVILYFLGSGPVRGFAISLGLGILTTIVTAVTMTRMMIALWYRWARPTQLPI